MAVAVGMPEDMARRLGPVLVVVVGSVSEIAPGLAVAACAAAPVYLLWYDRKGLIGFCTSLVSCGAVSAVRATGKLVCMFSMASSSDGERGLCMYCITRSIDCSAQIMTGI